MNLLMSNPLLTYITQNKRDAVEYKAQRLIDAADGDVYLVSQAVEEVNKMLSCINNDILLEAYAKKLTSITGHKVASLLKSVKSRQDEQRKIEEAQHVNEGEKALPKWINKERWHDHGFDWRLDTNVQENTGIYFHTGGGNRAQLTNFIIKPIIQIISDDENSKRRITEISNGYTSHVFELPSAAFISPDRFETILLDQGYYLTKDGFAKSHLNKIKTYFLREYKIGYEITNLGWQQEGFFAFSNAVYDNGIKFFNDYGLINVKDTNYLSMGASNILKNLRKGTDSYQNDKKLVYKPTSISWHKWTEIMTEVYGDKGMMGVSWALLAANRDIVLSRSNYCPLPYCYGPIGSGKSQLANSVIALYLHDMKMLNLNQVTIYTFWEYTSRFRNVPMGYNEFDVNSIPEAMTKAFKGMADNEGRLRGTGKKNKSETQEVNCLPMLMGQYLATIDDGSILSRTLAEKFVEVRDRPESQKLKFAELKALEKAGLSGLLVNILEHRGLIEAEYLETYNVVTRSLVNDFKAEGFTPKERIIENYTVVLTLMQLYMQRISFAFTYEEFYKYCKAQIRNLNTVIGESNTLGEFWQLLESCADKGYIEPGWDYKIETMQEVNSIIADRTSKSVSFDKPTRLLFLRFKDVYNVIAKEKKIISGKAMIPDSTVKTYITDQPYYVGAQSNGNFKSKKQGIKKGTSSMVINYDMLVNNGINLLESQEEDNRQQVVLEGFVHQGAKLENILNVEKTIFTLYQDESYYSEGERVEKKIYTRCLIAGRQWLRDLAQGTQIRVSGMLAVTHRNDKDWRAMDVQLVEIIRAVPGNERPADIFPETPVDKPQSFINPQLNFDRDLSADQGADQDDDLPF